VLSPATPCVQGSPLVVTAVRKQLASVDALLAADDVAALSAGGEPTFGTFCVFMMRLYFVALVCMPVDEAEATVVASHRAFLEKMLARRSFNAMLTLVREANSMLKRAQRPAPEPPGVPNVKLAPLLEWLRAHKVVEQLLKVNMHQYQYVESVQLLLTLLADVNALDKDVLNNLWGKLRQVLISSSAAASYLRSVAPAASVRLLLAC
jgi:hypothetical protein